MVLAKMFFITIQLLKAHLRNGKLRENVYFSHQNIYILLTSLDQTAQGINLNAVSPSGENYGGKFENFFVFRKTDLNGKILDHVLKIIYT